MKTFSTVNIPVITRQKKVVYATSDRKKSNIAHKMCEYEKIVREYTVEV